ncbi:Protein unc-45 A, partial [Cichlidogyrus casuarinus]
SELYDVRGTIVSAGGGKALIDLALKANTDKGQVAASHALAKLAINMDPRIVFPGQRSLETIRPILRLLHVECTAMQTFEALLALTNLASLDETHRHRIMAEHGVPAIDQYLFDEHEHLRRAAAECYSNLAQYHAFVVNCGGSLPMDESHLSIGKELTVFGSTERIKLLLLYCTEVEDLALVNAAAGALATMAYDPGIIEQITKVSSWFDLVQTLACIEAPAVQHRAAYLVRQLIYHGDKSLAEFLSKSSMFEVLLALSQLDDIDPKSEPPPSAVVLGRGLPKDVLLQKVIQDRLMTKKWAQQGLEKLQEYGFVMAVPENKREAVKKLLRKQKELANKSETITEE